jgi:hypothetical protein
MADTKISAMTAATDLTDAVFPIVQGGVNKKASESLVWKTSGTTELTGSAYIQQSNPLHEIGFNTKLQFYCSIDDGFGGSAADFTLNGGEASLFQNTTQTNGISFINGRMYLDIYNEAEIIGGLPTFEGLKYSTDYSANFDSRSIPDVDFVNNAVSDVRLKENITDLPSSTELIQQLRPVEFDMKKDGEHKAGFIAQELEQVFPNMVVESESGIKKIKRDQLVPYLVKCIQELTERIKILENGNN